MSSRPVVQFLAAAGLVVAAGVLWASVSGGDGDAEPFVQVLDGGPATVLPTTSLVARPLPTELEVRQLVTHDGPQLLVIARYVNSARRQIQVGALSRRELAIVGSLFDGLRVSQIAEEHGVAVKTIRNQLAAVYRKLEVGGQVELLATHHRPAQPEPSLTRPVS